MISRLRRLDVAKAEQYGIIRAHGGACVLCGCFSIVWEIHVAQRLAGPRVPVCVDYVEERKPKRQRRRCARASERIRSSR